VKLLLDENLSRRLVDRFADLFPGSTHVAFEELLQVSDARIWEYAKAGDFAIVTADADFYELATAFGPRRKSSGCAGVTIPPRLRNA
jgi:predicted nuclease of predicted toxin-antitoxin system